MYKWEFVMSVTINNRGAIIFPHKICVDGHEDGCFVRFVTHIHSDHIVDLGKSITYSKHIVATPITIDMIKAMNIVLPLNKTLTLDYGQNLDIDTENNVTISIARADHIPGSAQIVLTSRDFRVGYTGDFRAPGTRTEILKDLDVLVIDATYGNPSYRRESEEIIMNEFVKLLKKLLTIKPVAIYAYHGKINDIMIKLREWGLDTPYILPSIQWNIYRVLKKYGFETPDVFPHNSKEAEEIKKSGWYIEFNTTSKYSSLKTRKNVSHIIVTGRYGKSVIKLGTAWIVGLSGHADFNELVYYVDEARPQLLVVDGYRSSYAHIFSSYVKKSLGIESVVKPF